MGHNETLSKRMTVSQLRTLNAKDLRDLAGPLIICSDKEPVAVLVPYAQFIRQQRQFSTAVKIINTGGNLQAQKELTEAIHRVYDRYGPDLEAFFKDVADGRQKEERGREVEGKK